MRGKYDEYNRKYLLHLFTNMTEEERCRILSKSFSELWKELWCKEDDSIKNFNKEFHESYTKFSILQKGFRMKTSDGAGVIFFDLNYCVRETISICKESEWGFPKGRRNNNETDLTCALRELREETGINQYEIDIKFNFKPFEEIFSGTNNKRYKHVYFVAEMKSDCQDVSVIPLSKEIKTVKWMTLEGAALKIRDINVERKEILKRLSNIL
jgi:8-oxo-dGTP pyrophosphatase MutT (NUDIX family)